MMKVGKYIIIGCLLFNTCVIKLNASEVRQTQLIMPSEFADAIRHNNMAVIDAYLKQNPAYINAIERGVVGLHPLLMAIGQNNPDLVAYFIKKGADVNLKLNVSRPLQYAIVDRGGWIDKPTANAASLKIILLLLKNGAVLLPVDQDFYWSAERGDVDLVKILLNAGADIHEGVQFAELFADPLRAARSGLKTAEGADFGPGDLKSRMIKRYKDTIALLENYTKSRLESEIIKKGLMQRKGGKDIGSLVSQYVTGVQGSLKQVKAQEAALEEAREDLRNNNLEGLIKYIKTYPKLFYKPDESGDTLLFLAIKKNNADAVKLIIDSLVKLDQVEKNVNERLMDALGHTTCDGRNSYDLAQELNNEEIMDLLRPYYNVPVYTISESAPL